MKTKQSAAQFRRPRDLAPVDQGDLEGAVKFIREKSGLYDLIPVYRSVLTDRREDLDSALILLQEVQTARHSGNKDLDISSVLAGAHALVDRVFDCMEDYEGQKGEGAPQGKS